MPKANYKFQWNTPTASDPLPIKLVAPQAQPVPSNLAGTLADSTGAVLDDLSGGTLTTPKGDVINLPTPDSLSTTDAVQWEESAQAQIVNVGFNPNATLEEQAYQAIQLADAIKTAAMDAMVDANAAAQLNLLEPLQTLDDVSSEFSSKATGDALWKDDIQAAASQEVLEEAACQTDGACFVAGTLVHTPNGVVPIEEIRVGDRVLSQPELQGDVFYQRVLSAFSLRDKVIYRITYADGNGVQESVLTTADHPFWVTEKGWTGAEYLKTGQVLERHDRSKARVVTVENTGETQRVFNFEVEGCHTYYVGNMGVWVHNSNCQQVADNAIGGGGAADNVDSPNLASSTEEIDTGTGVVGGQDRVWAGMKYSENLPAPVDAEYVPSPTNTNGIIGAQGEVALANYVADVVGDDVIKWGANVNTKGIDLVSVDKSGNVTLWDSKVRTTTSSLKESSTFTTSSTLATELKQLQNTVENNPDLTTFQKQNAIANLKAGTYTTKTVGFNAAAGTNVEATYVNGARQGSATNFTITNWTKPEFTTDLASNPLSAVTTVIDDTAKALGPEDQDVATEGPNQDIAPLTQADASGLLAAASQYWLNAGAPAALLNSLTIDIGNLPVGVAAETVGSQITLSANGAGWGWFVDPNPTSEADFTATSDPNEFTANAGSPAAGKLDLLTVLIHEMGHVLGLGDVSDNADTMAQFLAPGTRRLPSADDIAQMLATVSQTLDYTGSVTSGIPQSIVNPPPTVVQAGPYVVGTVQATLADGNFANGLNGWSTSGTVTVNSSGDAVLANGTSADAQLTQTFNIDTSDQYLEFTVTNGMQANNGTAGPQDAFDVALDNANTGTSLVGADGLSNSDGVLNIQANGTESDASTISKTVNADGSTTYLVNLQNAFAGGAITAGTATLAFDLVGFGDSQSQVSIRDVQLVQNPVVALNENATVNEDGTVTLNPLAADPISSGSTPVLQLVTNPAHGTLTQNPDGTLTYTPNTHYFGTDSFQYSYSVNGTTSNVATVNIAVNEVAYPPTEANSSATVTAGTPYTFNPLSGANDINGNPMTAVLDTAPADGTLVVNADGTWTYTPNSNYAGADQLVYHISDGTANSQPVTVSFTVQQGTTHHAPVAQNGAVQVQEDGSLVINFANFGTDADGNPLKGIITAQPAHGTLTQNADGTYTYTPNQYYYGSDSLNFILNDGFLSSQPATLSITVNKVEIAPTLTNSSASLNEDGSTTLNPLANATDVNGDSLTASVITQPAHGTITVNANGTWTYTPSQYFYGTDTFTYSVSDGTASSNLATVTLSVNKVEVPPTLTNSSATLNEGSSTTLNLLASATDVNGDPVTAAIVTPPAHGTVTQNADGTWTYTPSQFFFGTDTFTYVVSDGQAASNVATVTINVTQVIHAPVAANDSVTTVSGMPINIAVLANDTDLDGNPLTPVIVSGASNGSLNVNADGTILYTPNSGFVGTDQFTYEDRDVNGVSNVATVTITVAAQGTLTVTGSTVSTNENTPYVFKWSDFNITEPSAPALYVKVEPLNNCSGGQLEVLGSDGCWSDVTSCVLLSSADVDAGKLRFVPAENETGFNGYAGTGLGDMAHDYASFTYSGYDGQVESAPVKMTVDVIPVATSPTLTISQQVSDVQQDLFRTTWESVGDPDSGATQVDQSTLEGWTAVGAPGFTVWSDGDVTTAPDGTSYSLYNGSWPGENFLQLAGGTGISRTVNTVAGMQYALVYDFASLPQDDSGSITLYVDGQPVQVACPPTSQSDTGLDWHEGQITFVGTGGAQTIQLMSGSSGVMLENVSLAQEPLNTGYQDTAIRLQQIAAGLADNGGSETLSLTLQGLPPGAVLTDGTNTFTATADQTSVDITQWNTGNLSITPPSGFYGSIPLTVTATALVPSNGSTASVTQNLPVTVLAAPVAQSSTVSTPENTPYVFQWSDFNVSDAQTTALSVDLSTWCQGGGYLEYLTSDGWQTAIDGLTVTKADLDAGKLRFVPYQNETGYSGYGGTGLGNLQGTYTLFTYQAFDGGTESAPVAMNIDVVPVATAPTITISQQVSDVQQDLFRTTWESVANPDSNATQVNQSTLEGWTAVGASGFTVWSDGDVTTAPDGTSYSLYNGSWPGENFLQLAGGTGLSRTVNTVAGMQYALVYDFASLPQDDSGSVTLYVDGQPVQVACPPTSQSATGLDWHEGQITFVGTGGAQTIQLMSGSSGVMLENVSLAQEPVNTGYQDTAIRLQNIDAELADNGGSETLSVTLQGLPPGAVLTDGTNTFTATADQGSVDITNWTTWNLSITPPSGFYGSIPLTVTATALVSSNGSSATVTQNLPVTVLAAPVAQSSTVTTPENTPYVFQWSDFNVSDAQTSALSVDLSTYCQGGGHLEYLTDEGWQTEIGGVTVTKADLDAGKLRFVPDPDETGYSGYGDSGLGNLQGTYSLFTYQAFDGGTWSAPVSMNIDVIPVATAPTLSISQQVSNVQQDLFHTTWESVGDPDSGATQVNQSTLEGWTAVGAPGFTAWSDGDVTTAPDGTSYTLYSGYSPGENFLQLAGGTGISRTINTVAGMQYVLVYDFASLPQDDSGSVTLYVDGQAVQVECPPTSQSDTGLDWREGQINFVGTGGAQTIQLMSGSTGVMLENVSLAQEPVNTGYQDTAIRLQQIDAELADRRGSETLSVTLRGLPAGAVLTDGTNTFTATADQGSVDITNWTQWNLSITPPSGFYGSIPLTVTATALVPSNGSTASVSQSLPVTVLAAPVAQSSTVSTPENTPYVFQWSDFNISDAQTTALSVDLSTWCQGGGYLQYLTSGGWQTESDGLTVTKADIDAGKLRFVPYQDETGYSGYGDSGLGNLQGTYTLFTYQASDGGTESAPVSMNIDVIPVATAPTITLSGGCQPVNTGYENTSIQLQQIDAELVDRGGSEILSVEMEDIPVGAVLTDGTNTFTAAADQTSVDVTQWDTGSLSITPPSGFYGSIPLTVTATALVPSNGSSASVSQSLPVTVQQASLSMTKMDVAEAPAASSATSQVALSGMPVGTTLSDGTHSAMTTAASPSVDITGWNTNTLSVTTPVGYNGTLTLQVAATGGGKANFSQNLTVPVDTVAQVPTLTLLPPASTVSRTLINTTWPRVGKNGYNATILDTTEFAGWSTTPVARGKNPAFEVWASDDQMRNAQGTNQSVQGLPGAGQEWLGLSNGVGSIYQAPGIAQSFDTVGDAQYTFNFDYAGQLGLGSANTQIGVYLDGQLLGLYSNVSTNSLNWQTLGYSFKGDGKSHTLSIELINGTNTSTPRGAMLDSLTLTETLPDTATTVYGFAGSAIPLPQISDQLAANDPGQLETTLVGLPVGATVGNGRNNATITSPNQVLERHWWESRQPYVDRAPKVRLAAASTCKWSSPVSSRLTHRWRALPRTSPCNCSAASLARRPRA